MNRFEETREGWKDRYSARDTAEILRLGMRLRTALVETRKRLNSRESEMGSEDERGTHRPMEKATVCRRK